MTDTASRTRRSTTCSTQAEAESDPAKREQLYQEANRKIMAFVACCPVCAQQRGYRTRQQHPGLRPEPRRSGWRILRDRRGRGGRRRRGNRGDRRHRDQRPGVAHSEQPADDVDASLRRPPAASARPDPARALDPAVLLDQGVTGRARGIAARRSGDARGGRGDRADLRPRPADLRAVPEVPREPASRAISARASPRGVRSPRRSGGAFPRRSSSRSPR